MYVQVGCYSVKTPRSVAVGGHSAIEGTHMCRGGARPTSSMILAKSLETSLPLSLNHLLNRLCALTSMSCPCANLRTQRADSQPPLRCQPCN